VLWERTGKQDGTELLLVCRPSVRYLICLSLGRHRTRRTWPHGTIKQEFIMSDPNNVFGIDASTTVYPALRLVDAWGILGVTDDAWLVRDANGHLVRTQYRRLQAHLRAR